MRSTMSKAWSKSLSFLRVSQRKKERAAPDGDDASTASFSDDYCGPLQSVVSGTDLPPLEPALSSAASGDAGGGGGASSPRDSRRHRTRDRVRRIKQRLTLERVKPTVVGRDMALVNTDCAAVASASGAAAAAAAADEQQQASLASSGAPPLPPLPSFRRVRSRSAQSVSFKAVSAADVDAAVAAAAAAAAGSSPNGGAATLAAAPSSSAPSLTPAPSGASSVASFVRRLSWRTESRRRFDAALQLEKRASETVADADLLGDDERLAQRLRRLQLDLLVARGDGNCQFRSLSRQLWDTEDHHAALRAHAVAHIAARRAEFAPFLGGDAELEGYLRGMTRNGTWGDELTLRALCDALGVVITLITSAQRHWLLLYEPEALKSCQEVVLAYVAPIHYNSVRRRKGHHGGAEAGAAAPAEGAAAATAAQAPAAGEEAAAAATAAEAPAEAAADAVPA